MSTHPRPAAHDGDALAAFVDQRDEAAFATLVTRHQALVHGVCRRIIGDAHDADDAAQAVFLVLAMKAGKLRDSACVAGWLHRVSRHVALRARSANERRRRRIAPLASDPAAPMATDLELDAALDALSETYRTPLLLHYVEGMSCEQIGERLAISADAAAMRLSRGRDRLRRRLAVSALGVLAAGAAAGCSSPDPCALAALAARVASGIDGVGSHAVSALALQASRALAWAPAKMAAGWMVALLTVGSAVTVAAQAVDRSAPVPESPPHVAAQPQAPAPAVTESEYTNDGLVQRVFPAGQLRIERLLRQPVSLDAHGLTAKEALGQVATSTGVTIVLEGGAGSGDVPVTLAVQGMKAHHVLDFMARLTGTCYAVAGDGVHWGEEQRAPLIRFHLDRVADRPADVPTLAALVVSECEAYREARQDFDSDGARDGGAPWHRLDGEVLEVEGRLEQTVARELLLDLRDPDRTKPSGAELDWRKLRQERHAWSFKDEDLLVVADKVRRESGMDLDIAPEVIANGPKTVTYGTPDATNEELVRAIAEAAHLYVIPMAEERRIFVREGIAQDEPRRVGYHIRAERGEPSLWTRAYADLPYAELLAARLRAIDPDLHAIAWNRELVVWLDLPGHAALEALLVQLHASPEEDRAGCIAAFTLPEASP